MGYVDTAKRIRGTLVEKFLPPHVVFHHVPKCGGTSIGRALRMRYILSQRTILTEPTFRMAQALTEKENPESLVSYAMQYRESMLIYLMYCDVRCIAAHVAFSETAYEKFHHRYRFITVLRDPVERFISHYYYTFQEHPHSGRKLTLDEFLETREAEYTAARYVEYFSGNATTGDIYSTQAVESAIRNLSKFKVIGFLDRLESFKSQLRQELGIRLSIGHENRNRQKIGNVKETVTDAQERKVRQLCEADLEIYEYARKYSADA